MLHDGIHEGIISETDWELAHQKREKTLEAEAEWELSPVFAALPEAFLKTGLGAVNYHTRGKFIYEI